MPPLSGREPEDAFKVLNYCGAVTPEMALRLELVFERPFIDHWLRLQNAHDLWQCRKSQSSIHAVPIGVSDGTPR